MVVKVVRSPSGPIAPGESHAVVEKLRRMAEVWLREVKIHSQLSQHVSLALGSSSPCLSASPLSPPRGACFNYYGRFRAGRRP